MRCCKGRERVCLEPSPPRPAEGLAEGNINGACPYLVIGSCVLSDEDIRQITKDAGIPVGGSGGGRHTWMGNDNMMPHWDTTTKTRTMDLRTPWDYQEFKRVP